MLALEALYYKKNEDNLRNQLFFCNFAQINSNMRKIIAPTTSQITANQLIRQSNNELLRIVCMFFIVFHHFIMHAVFPNIVETDSNLDMGTAAATLTEGFLYIGVNCFVLISGYYQIRLRWKSIFNLFLTCAFYGFIGYIFHLWHDNASIGRGAIYYSILILSHGNWWFIHCYVILMLLSPILNAAIRQLSQKQLFYVIICLTICQVYFGYFWQIPQYDISGYHFLQFVYLYVIGSYIRRYTRPSKGDRGKYLAIYAGCAIVWGVVTCIGHKFDLTSFWWAFNYNNPVLVVEAIAFFLLFQTFDLKSPIINKLASGTLAVYLLQDGVYSHSLWYGTAASLTATLAWPVKYLAALLFSIVFLVAVMCADQLRIRMMRPILNKISKIDEKHPLFDN